MPEYLAPGVYVEEVPTRSHPIEGVSTSTAAFIGLSQRAAAPVAITSFAEFERAIGRDAGGYLSLAIKGFFENGGKLCHVALITASDPLEVGLQALANHDISILCCPDEHAFPNAAAALAAHCEQRRDRFCILQSAQPVLPEQSHVVSVHSSHAAYYYPWIAVAGTDGANVTVPPGGHIAGVYVRIGMEKGVASAPAGVPVAGARALSQDLNTAQSDLLVSRGINVLRNLPGKGLVIWSARTTSEDPEWKYIGLRRLMIFVEESIRRGLQWAVFEPNAAPLWATARGSVDTFVAGLWSTGALIGQKPEEAWFTRCDSTTMTQEDIDAGRFIMIVGMAPVRPAEFVIIRITCQTRANDSTDSR